MAASCSARSLSSCACSTTIASCSSLCTPQAAPRHQSGSNGELSLLFRQSKQTVASGQLPAATPLQTKLNCQRSQHSLQLAGRRYGAMQILTGDNVRLNSRMTAQTTQIALESASKPIASALSANSAPCSFLRLREEVDRNKCRAIAYARCQSLARRCIYPCLCSKARILNFVYNTFPELRYLPENAKIGTKCFVD